jgi:cysteinyl-tRNA synthetase
MDIKIYNTLTKKKEVFRPLKEASVGIYNCGPTVYDTPHIGNYRTFIMDDIIRRVFEWNNYTVNQVMNITDVDDKTINRSHKDGITLKQLTSKYEKLFLEELDVLHIKKPHTILRATDKIADMIDMIATLLEKGFAYKTEDGIYMHINKVPDYGNLAGLKFKPTETKDADFSRIKGDEYDKDNLNDFALWKFKTTDDGDNFWTTPFGDGRPGWHIECSAMAKSALGQTIDIHTGGSDLIFPHHTNEIAQSECANDAKFANYWIHGGFMNVKGSKMSKSKNNFLKLSDLQDITLSPLAFRYWTMTAHYRTQIDFTEEAVSSAQNALIRLIQFAKHTPRNGNIIQEYIDKFHSAINDDFDMPKAVSIVWEIMKDKQYSDTDKLATIIKFDEVLGLDIKSIDYEAESIDELPPEIQALIEARDEARKDRDWQKSDALRDEIESRGYEVKDSPDGTIVVSI